MALYATLCEKASTAQATATCMARSTGIVITAIRLDRVDDDTVISSMRVVFPRIFAWHERFFCANIWPIRQHKVAQLLSLHHACVVETKWNYKVLESISNSANAWHKIFHLMNLWHQKQDEFKNLLIIKWLLIHSFSIAVLL